MEHNWTQESDWKYCPDTRNYEQPFNGIFNSPLCGDSEMRIEMSSDDFERACNCVNALANVKDPAKFVEAFKAMRDTLQVIKEFNWVPPAQASRMLQDHRRGKGRLPMKTLSLTLATISALCAVGLLADICYGFWMAIVRVYAFPPIFMTLFTICVFSGFAAFVIFGLADLDGKGAK